MQKKLLFVFLFLNSLFAQTTSPHTISIFFENYPVLENNSFKQKPLPKNVNPINGIPVSYFGYQCSSNKIGHVILPRKHQNPSFTIIVTEKIDPIVMTENTLYAWQVHKQTPHVAYTITRKQDEQTKLTYWETKKITLKETPEKDHNKTSKNEESTSGYILPTTAIIITANSNDIVIEEGVTLTTHNSQLLLPTIYVKRTINNPINALYALENRLFYDPLLPVYQVTGKEKEVATQMKQS